MSKPDHTKKLNNFTIAWLLILLGVAVLTGGFLMDDARQESIEVCLETDEFVQDSDQCPSGVSDTVERPTDNDVKVPMMVVGGIPISIGFVYRDWR